jgi:hypothetical protein
MSKVSAIAPKSLDERLAAVLTSDEHRPSSVLADLIRETDEAIDGADQAGREARAAANDPKVIDAGARGRAEDAEHMAHRLRNGMEALRQLHREAQLREQLHEWHKLADAVEAKRDVVASEFKECYPALAAWLPDVLQRMAAVDREIEHVNATAPGHESRRLASTELTARGADGWGLSKPVGKVLRLPQFSGLEPLLWPLPQQFGVALMGMFPANGSPVESVARGVSRFELIDGVIRAIGANGEVLESIAVDQPVPPPLHPEMTLREQALAEEAERAAVAAKHAEDGRARERERQRLNDARENSEFARRQQAISR